MALNPGTLLNNRYRIVSILGHGGMGSVYRAEDEILGISVAVKENLFLSDEYARQFQHEAKILASLRHPNLPRVGDYCYLEGQGQYLIMDYIEGEDLRQRIERLTCLPEREVILIGFGICDALSYLHSRQPPVVHRDIKPGNIKITPEGEMILVDFGLAKLMRTGQATTTGARAMTPGYSPPEQYGTARTDHRTDVYSLGATLYAALTGVIPEDGLARATGKADLTPIRELQPKVKKNLAVAIEKSLAVEPEDRFQSAEDFKKALVATSEFSEAFSQRLVVTPPPADFKPAFEIPSEELIPEKSNNKPLSGRNSSAPHPQLFPQFNRLWFAILLIGVISGGFLTRTLWLPGMAAAPSQTPSSIPSLVATDEGALGLTATPPVNITPSHQATPKSVFPLTTVARTPIKGPPEPTGTGGGMGQIAFASNRTGIFQIWLMDSAGNNQKQITSLTGGACQPFWSPDGNQLVVISPCETKGLQYTDSRLFIINSDGSNPHPIPLSLPGDSDPAWSPEGRRIAFTSNRTGTPHIFVYNLDSLTLEELSDTRYSDMHPTWNPSGKQLAFVRENPFNHIWIMSDKGETQFQFSTPGNANDLWPNWSMDGKFILFSRSLVEPSIPWLLRLNYEDRGTAKEIHIPPLGAIDPGPIGEPSLSPDGSYIAYESWPDGNNHDIYLIDQAGTIRQRLTTDPGFDFDPAWRPLVSSDN